MSEASAVGAFAIIPSNDLPLAIAFWDRMGFARTGGDENYVIIRGWGCEVHLTQAGSGPWRVPKSIIRLEFSSARLRSLPSQRGWTIESFVLGVFCATVNGASMRWG